jgi:hypothetical protein
MKHSKKLDNTQAKKDIEQWKIFFLANLGLRWGIARNLMTKVKQRHGFLILLSLRRSIS